MHYVIGTGGWARRDAAMQAALDGAAGVDDRAPSSTVLRAASASYCVVARPRGPLVPGGPLKWVDTAGGALLVDGCSTSLPGQPGDPAGFDLGNAWSGLRGSEAGQYVACRLDRRDDRLELCNDILGMRQAYYVETADGWLLGNSVRALATLASERGFDDVGVSTFLALEWLGRDRTLVGDVRVLPSASHWVWSNGATSPAQRSYLDLYDLIRVRRTSRTPTTALRSQLGDACERVSAHYTTVESGLTGGRDSRLVLSLLRERGIDAEFLTSGEPHSHELELSRDLAAAAGVRHRQIDKGHRRLAEQWDQATAQLVASTDGMVTLWQVADVVGSDVSGSRRSLTFWGVGGEIARAHFCNPGWFPMRKSPASVAGYLRGKFVAWTGDVLRPESVVVVREYLDRFVRDALEQGVALDDVPDALYLAETIRRKIGTNARKAPDGNDLYSPFVTRPFIEAAFALSPQMRYAEALHRRLLRPDPLLFGRPFEKEPWRVQVPWVVLAQRAWRKTVVPRLRRRPRPTSPTIDQRALLELKLPEIRAACLDAASSPIWDFVDRARFDEVTAPGAARSERTAHMIYRTLTLHTWERSLDVGGPSRFHRRDAPLRG